MRGLVLILVGASLLWLVVSKLRTTEAAVIDDDPAAEIVQTEDDAEFLSRPGAVAAAEPDGSVTNEESESVAYVPETEEQPTLSTTSTSADDGGEWTTADEIGLAGRLLHDPVSVATFIESKDGLSDDRRGVILGLKAAVEGDRGTARKFLDRITSDSSAEVALLRAAVEAENVRALPASLRRDSFLSQSASMALAARKGRALLDGGHSKDAAKIFSDLLKAELEAPWSSDPKTLGEWSTLLHKAQEGWRWNRLADWPAIETTVQSGDSLTVIRARILKEHGDLLLCTGLIERANEIVGKIIHPDDPLRIPTDRASAYVDVSSRWVLYMMADEVVAAWQVGVGKPGHETRLGDYTAGEKEEDPMWFRPGKAPVPFGDELNPLGTRWIAWFNPDGKKSSLGFHGTNEPQGMGKAVSEGCIRMRNAEVEELFEILPRGATITVRP